jgi:hypothetical protein
MGSTRILHNCFSLSHREAGEKLLRGEIDAALMMTSWDSPVVRRLISDENIELVSFLRADALFALYPFLNKLTVPAGVGDLAKNLPPKDVILFAPKASLVVRRICIRQSSSCFDAAQQIHSGPGIFQKSGQFPAAETIDLPLSDDAIQFYKSGRPFSNVIFHSDGSVDRPVADPAHSLARCVLSADAVNASLIRLGNAVADLPAVSRIENP